MRAWDFSKPLLLAPAMNTAMWLHPLTSQQLRSIGQWFPPSSPSSPGVVVLDPIAKLLACGDRGAGAMADVADIARVTRDTAEAAIASRRPSDGEAGAGAAN